MARPLVLLVAIAALVLAPACGGGSSSRDTSTDVTLNAPPEGAFDGFTAAHPTQPIPWVYNNFGTGISVGDWLWLTFADEEVRGFLSFNTGGVPDAPAVVRAAYLTIELSNFTGAPLPLGTQIMIEHVDLGPTFDGNDHNVAALAGGDPIGTVTTTATTGPYTIDVRAQVGKDQIEGRNRTSFRMRVQTPGGINNAADDTANFNDAEDNNGTGVIPKLTITYSP